MDQCNLIALDAAVQQNGPDVLGGLERSSHFRSRTSAELSHYLSPHTRLRRDCSFHDNTGWTGATQGR